MGLCPKNTEASMNEALGQIWGYVNVKVSNNSNRLQLTEY